MRIGSLCTGYGGLDMAVRDVLGGGLAWWSDIEAGLSINQRLRLVGNGVVPLQAAAAVRFLIGELLVGDGPQLCA